MINASVDPVRKAGETIAATTENVRIHGGLTNGGLTSSEPNARPSGASSAKLRHRCRRSPCGSCRTHEPLKA